MSNFVGYVYTDMCELRRVEITKDGEYVNVWESGEIRDDIETKEDYARRTDGFYETPSDFKAGKVLSIDEVWPE